MRPLILVSDDEYQPIGFFRSAAASVSFCDKHGASMFAHSNADTEGELISVKSFWRAALVLDDGSVETSRSHIYKCGSHNAPCRDGYTFAGRVVSQELDYIVAWGATKKQAVARVVAQHQEGRRRAARDRAWDAVVNQEKPSVADGWDPYGFWMSEDLKSRAKQASEKAYSECTPI